MFIKCFLNIFICLSHWAEFCEDRNCLLFSSFYGTGFAWCWAHDRHSVSAYWRSDTQSKPMCHDDGTLEACAAMSLLAGRAVRGRGVPEACRPRRQSGQREVKAAWEFLFSHQGCHRIPKQCSIPLSWSPWVATPPTWAPRLEDWCLRLLVPASDQVLPVWFWSILDKCKLFVLYK